MVLGSSVRATPPPALGAQSLAQLATSEFAIDCVVAQENATDVTVQREAADRAQHFTRLVDDLGTPTLVLEFDDRQDPTTLRVVRSNAAAAEWSAAGPLDGYLGDQVPWLRELDLGGDYSITDDVTYGVLAAYGQFELDEDAGGNDDTDAFYRLYHKFTIKF